MSELKPCPFCGVQSELISGRIYTKHSQFCILYATVGCDFKKTAWNTRPIEDELRATIAKMDQDHAQSLAGKLAMVGKLEELEGLRKKLNAAYVMLAEWTAFVDKLNSGDDSVYHHFGWIKYRIHTIQSVLKGDQ